MRRAAELGAPLTAPQLTLEGGNELLLERHHGIIEYTDTRVVVAAGMFTLRVTGTRLSLVAMDAGALRLKGRFDALELLWEDGR